MSQLIQPETDNLTRKGLSMVVIQGPTLSANKCPGDCPMADSTGDVFNRKVATLPTNKLVISFPFQTLPHNGDEEFVGEEVCRLHTEFRLYSN